MLRAYGIALAVDILLVVANGTIPFCHGYLPLGGTDLAQLGVLLGLASVYSELDKAFRGHRHPPTPPGPHA